LTVEEGVIREANIFGDFFGVQDKAALEERLTGVRHERQAILDALARVDLGQYIHGVSAEDFAGMF
jgi:lipoate-protein ligase A